MSSDEDVVIYMWYTSQNLQENYKYKKKKTVGSPVK